MPVATATTAHEDVACRLGSFTYRACPPLRPTTGTGFPRYDGGCGKTMRGWTGYFCGIQTGYRGPVSSVSSSKINWASDSRTENIFSQWATFK